jgi:hypothetical protein
MGQPQQVRKAGGVIPPDKIMFIPKLLNDFPITVPSHRHRLDNIMSGKLTFPAHGVSGICLYGSFGTGKTTLAKLLPVLLEAGGHLPKNSATGAVFQAPSLRSATTFIRCGESSTLSMLQGLEKTLGGQFSCSSAGYHYVIFDEAQGLKREAMRPMRAIMSATDQAVFIFTTNDFPALDGGIKSRCHEVEMNLPDVQGLIGVGQKILGGMGLTLDAIRLAEIASLAKDYRKFSTDLQEAGVPA